MTSLCTIGHGTLSEDRFLEVVVGARIEVVVDVRRYPGSRRYPHFAREVMARWLSAGGVGYRWLDALGGRRQPRSDSVNTGWRNLQFRAYADHMATADFAAGVGELKELGAHHAVAVMCSESVWWRCHRRLLADHLVLVEGIPVCHIFHDGRLVAHQALDGARREDSHLIYPAVAPGQEEHC